MLGKIVRKPAVLNTASLAISSGLNFVSLLLWVRLLTPEDFGRYTLITTTSLLINAALFEWVRIVGGRTLYSATSPTRIDPDRANAMFTIVSGLLLALAVTAALLFARGHPIFGLPSSWAWVLLLFVASEVTLTMLNVVSRVRAEAWHTFWVIVSRSVLSLAIGVILVTVYGQGLTGVILGIVIGQMAATIGGIATDVVWRRLRWRLRRAQDRREMAQVLHMGAPLMLSAGLSYGVGVFDRYQVEHVLGTPSVAFYAAPADLLQKTIGFVMLAINITAYPAMVRAYEDRGPAAARTMLEGNAVLHLAVGLPVVVAAIVLPDAVSNLLLGGRLAARSAVILPYVTVAAFLRLLTIYHLQVAFQLTRNMRFMLIGPTIAVATFVLLGVPALRHFGLPGIAYVSLLAQSLSYGLCAIMAARSFRMRLYNRDMAKVVGAGAVMAAVMLPFAGVTGIVASIATLAGGGTAYLAAIWLFRLEQVQAVIAKFAAPART